MIVKLGAGGWASKKEEGREYDKVLSREVMGTGRGRQTKSRTDGDPANRTHSLRRPPCLPKSENQLLKIISLLYHP